MASDKIIVTIDCTQFMLNYFNKFKKEHWRMKILDRVETKDYLYLHRRQQISVNNQLIKKSNGKNRNN